MVPSQYSSTGGWVMIWPMTLTPGTHPNPSLGASAFPRSVSHAWQVVLFPRGTVLARGFGGGAPVWPGAHTHSHQEISGFCGKTAVTPNYCLLFPALAKPMKTQTVISASLLIQVVLSDKWTWQFRPPWARHFAFLGLGCVNYGQYWLIEVIPCEDICESVWETAKMRDVVLGSVGVTGHHAASSWLEVVLSEHWMRMRS